MEALGFRRAARSDGVLYWHPSDPFFTCQRCGDLSRAADEACLWPSLIALKGDKHHYRTRKCFGCAQAGVPCSCAVDPKDYDFVIEPGQNTVIKDWAGRTISMDVLRESHQRIIDAKRLEGRERERSGRKRKRANIQDEDAPQPLPTTAFTPAAVWQGPGSSIRGAVRQGQNEFQSAEQSYHQRSTSSTSELNSSKFSPLHGPSHNLTIEASPRPPSTSPLPSLWRHRHSARTPDVLRASPPARPSGMILPPILAPGTGPSEIPTLPRLVAAPPEVRQATEALYLADSTSPGGHGDGEWQARAKFVRDAEQLSGVPLTQSFLHASRTQKADGRAEHHLLAADNLMRRSRLDLEAAHHKLTGSGPIFRGGSGERPVLLPPDVEQDEEGRYMGAWRERANGELDLQTRRLQSLREQFEFYGNPEDAGACEADSHLRDGNHSAKSDVNRERLESQGTQYADPRSYHR